MSQYLWMKQWIRLVGVLGFTSMQTATLMTAERAIAHGVKIEHKSTPAIEVTAIYDSGEPMKNAQVTVYPPNSDNAWTKGTTNDQGKFNFVPDSSQAGNWEVKIRQAGHGGIVVVPVGEGAIANSSEPAPTAATTTKGTSFTPLQLLLMVGSVTWGFIGTALYFSGRKV